MSNDFILRPGLWIGEGKITFSTSPQFIKFYTKWIIKEESPGVLSATQTVEMQGIKEHGLNYFTIEDISKNGFAIILDNELMGRVEGKGVINSKTIGWEFRQSSFEGFEIYERQENGDYALHAEYASPEQHRTIIDGLIWEKVNE